MFARWTPLEQYLLSKVRGILLRRTSVPRLLKMLKPFTSEWIIPQTLIVTASLGGIQLGGLRSADVFPDVASLPPQLGRTLRVPGKPWRIAWAIGVWELWGEIIGQIRLVQSFVFVASIACLKPHSCFIRLICWLTTRIVLRNSIIQLQYHSENI